VPTRAVGVLLFLPVPLVLFLFTRAPLGILPSLGVGVLLMATHRLYARPWALARSHSRCLWCGADVAPQAPLAVELAIEEPLGGASWRACREAHARPVRAVLGWAAAYGGFLKLGILGTLGVFLAWGAGSGSGWPVLPEFEHAVAVFRLGIAATVLPLGWLAARAEPAPAASPRAPFPLHVPALVGLRTVLWLFRLVGLLWLAQAALHAARETGILG
jgi:hypothetical protein